jgi:hypothetical protein
LFVGHYSVSFALKAVEPRLPLWLLFLSVQLADVFWSIFVWVGLEKVRIVPGITASNPLDLYYMPYTHSLVAAVLWSAAAVAGYGLWRRGGTPTKVGLLVGLAVFSHWALDFVVHRPDLPLYDNTAKVGLGLWNFPAVAFLLEASLLFGGLLWYLKSSRPVGAAGRHAMLVFCMAMLGAHAIVFFGAPPTSSAMAAGMALGSYIILAVVAGWLERKRTPSPV